jgi:hypothetical protein
LREKYKLVSSPALLLKTNSALRLFTRRPAPSAKAWLDEKQTVAALAAYRSLSPLGAKQDDETDSVLKIPNGRSEFLV